MNTNRYILFAILMLLLTVSVSGQRGHRGHRGWPKLDSQQREARHQFVDRVVDELKKSVGDQLEAKKISRFRGMARFVVRQLNEEEFTALRAQPIGAQVKAVAEAWEKAKEAVAQKFIVQQTPAVQAELKGLDPKQRDKRIAELKILATLERSIASAESHQLIPTGEADRLRGLVSSEQLKESRRLNREVFFAIHGAEIKAKDQQRLKKLSDNKFWRDATVRRFQLLRHINAEEIEKLRKLESADRMKFFRSLRTGKDLDAFVKKGILSKETASNWSKLREEDRRRVVRDLMQVYLPNFRGGIRPNRKQMSQFTRDEMRQFFMMKDKERLKFLKTKFPNENWDKVAEQNERRREVEKQLEGMDRRERGALRSMMPSVAQEKLKTLFDGDDKKAAKVLSEMESLDWFRSVVPAIRELRGELEPAERLKLKKMNTVETVDFLFARFPEKLNAQAEAQLKAADKSLPKSWGSLPGSQKVEFLNRNGLRMPWGKSKFGKREGRGRAGRGEDRLGPPGRKARPGRDGHGPKRNPEGGRRARKDTKKN